MSFKVRLVFEYHSASLNKDSAVNEAMELFQKGPEEEHFDAKVEVEEASPYWYEPKIRKEALKRLPCRECRFGSTPFTVYYLALDEDPPLQGLRPSRPQCLIPHMRLEDINKLFQIDRGRALENCGPVIPPDYWYYEDERLVPIGFMGQLSGRMMRFVDSCFNPECVLRRF